MSEVGGDHALLGHDYVRWRELARNWTMLAQAPEVAEVWGLEALLITVLARWTVIFPKMRPSNQS